MKKIAALLSPALFLLLQGAFSQSLSVLQSEKYHVYRNGLNNSLQKFNNEKTGRVAFLGGSITYNPGWRDSICLSLQKRFPHTTFEFIRAGIPSLGSVPNAFRLNDDVLSKGKIDLLFVEAAVNDRTNGYPGVSQVRAMEGIVRQARSVNPYTDIVFMYFVDPDKMKDYDNGVIPQEILNHEKVAAHYGIPAVNLAKEVTDRSNNQEFTWEGDFRNLHPSPFGQQVYFRSIASLLENCYNHGPVTKANNDLPSPLDPFNYDSGILIPVRSRDAARGWTYFPSWEPSDKVSTREGYVRSPVLAGEIPGKILKYKFEGNAIGIAAISGPDAGIIEHSIDQGPWKKLDLFTQWSNSVHLPWFLTLYDGLKNGSHTLRIHLTDDNSNHPGLKSTCRIRYFYVNRKAGR